MTPGVIEVYSLLAFIFLGIPAKIIYDNVAGLRPMARFLFALTAPVIFFVCMITCGPIVEFFSSLQQTYADIIGAAIGISFSLLVVFLWHRLFWSVARKLRPN